MTAAVASLFVTAVLLLFPPRTSRWVPAFTRDRGPASTTSRQGRFRRLGALTARVRRPGRRGAAAPDADAELLAVVEGLGAALGAGLPPADALAQAIPPPRGGVPTPLGRALVDLRDRARAGEPLATAWADLAERVGSGRLRPLARAWALSEDTGAPLAAATRTAARLLREEQDRRRQTAAAIAGARATMRLLTLLSLGGPVLAVGMGLDLQTVYLAAPAAWLCVGAGVALVVLGHGWVERLLRGALRGPLLR